MPCYNEAPTLSAAIKQVLASPLVGELIVVDDGSTDDSASIAETFDDDRLVVVRQGVNCGKGAAVRVGFGRCTLPFVIVQDADLEYDPGDWPDLLEPLLDGRADVVFGSRFVGAGPHRVLYFWHYVGNRVLTTVSNMVTNLNLSDMETCTKVFRREVVESLELVEDRFGFEPEVTAKVARLGCRVYEVGVSYSGRTYAEGKKIGARDGFRAVWCVVRYSAPVERARHWRAARRA